MSMNAALHELTLLPGNRISPTERAPVTTHTGAIRPQTHPHTLTLPLLNACCSHTGSHKYGRPEASASSGVKWLNVSREGRSKDRPYAEPRLSCLPQGLPKHHWYTSASTGGVKRQDWSHISTSTAQMTPDTESKQVKDAPEEVEACLTQIGVFWVPYKPIAYRANDFPR